MNVTHFELFKDSKGEFRFRLRAKNGEIILRSSEGFTTKQNCQKGIDSVKANAPFDERYKRGVSQNNQYYFVLKVRNGEALGISEMYTTVSAREHGIKLVNRDAPTAPVQDLTLAGVNS